MQMIVNDGVECGWSGPDEPGGEVGHQSLKRYGVPAGRAPVCFEFESVCGGVDRREDIARLASLNDVEPDLDRHRRPVLADPGSSPAVDPESTRVRRLGRLPLSEI